MKRCTILLFALFGLALAEEFNVEIESLRKHEAILNKTAETYRKEGYNAFADMIDHEYVDVDKLKNQYDTLNQLKPTDPQEIQRKEMGLVQVWFSVYLKNVNFGMFHNRTRLAEITKLKAVEQFAGYTEASGQNKDLAKLKDIVVQIIEQENAGKNPDDLYSKIFAITQQIDDYVASSLAGLEAYIQELKSRHEKEPTERAEKYEKMLVLPKVYLKLVHDTEPLDSKDKVDKIVESFQKNVMHINMSFLGEDKEYLPFMISYIKKQKESAK